MYILKIFEDIEKNSYTDIKRIEVSYMPENIRKTGINVIGDVPWGTHFCQFYHTKEDLLDILIPYFKTGLENNEFCMWVVSYPLTVEEAKEALKGVMPNLDLYQSKKQIEIVSHTDWYLKDGSSSYKESWMAGLRSLTVP